MISSTLFAPTAPMDMLFNWLHRIKSMWVYFFLKRSTSYFDSLHLSLFIVLEVLPANAVGRGPLDILDVSIIHVSYSSNITLKRYICRVSVKVLIRTCSSLRTHNQGQIDPFEETVKTVQHSKNKNTHQLMIYYYPF